MTVEGEQRFAPERDAPPVSGHKRRLDLARGVAEARFDRGGVRHRREVFVSRRDQVVAARFRCSAPGSLAFRVGLFRHRAEVKAVDERTLSLAGRADGEGTRFAGRLRLVVTGGSVEALGGRLLVRGANEAKQPCWGRAMQPTERGRRPARHGAQETRSDALGGLHRPLLQWLRFVSASGERTAAAHQGCRGWTMHHVADPWGFTAPGDAAACGLWPIGGAWCALHAWEHFLHGRDAGFLRETGYPLMRGASLFLLDFLQPTASGELVTGPRSAPENRYALPNGETGTLCMGPTMDHQIVRELFGACAEAAALLGVDAEFTAELAAALERVPPTRVGPHGTIAEWHGDPKEADPGHRHLSPLFGLDPGTQIDPPRTPDLAAAARRTIERRLAHATDDSAWSAGRLTSATLQGHKRPGP